MGYPIGPSSLEGNINLCTSCHTGGAQASTLALYSVDQASITATGVYGRSHRWDAIAYQVNIATDPQTVSITYKKDRLGNLIPVQTITPPKYAKVFKEVSGPYYRIACSSCHNGNTASFIRNDKERDQKLCAECHIYQKNLGGAKIYTGQVLNHPTKAVGTSYVGCSSCHVIHAK